jgi:hypothetical protein
MMNHSFVRKYQAAAVVVVENSLSIAITNSPMVASFSSTNYARLVF